jgi:hypothetical protein
METGKDRYRDDFTRPHSNGVKNMPCFDVPMWKEIREDWYPNITDVHIRSLRQCGGDLQAVYRHINGFFNAHLMDTDRNEICVTINCRNPWPQVLDDLYVACGNDEDEAAMFLGGLFCRVAIKRPDWWWCSPLPVFKNRPDPHKWVTRKYHVGSDPKVRAKKPRHTIPANNWPATEQ